MGFHIKIYRSNDAEPVWGAGELFWQRECPSIEACKRWGKSWKDAGYPTRAVAVIESSSGSVVFHAFFAPAGKDRRVTWYWGSPRQTEEG